MGYMVAYLLIGTIIAWFGFKCEKEIRQQRGKPLKEKEGPFIFLMVCLIWPVSFILALYKLIAGKDPK